MLSVEDIEFAVYRGTLRALVDYQHPNEKYRRWTMWKSGKGFVEIAKSERPKLAEQVGIVEAKKQWAEDSDAIRKQIERIEKSMSSDTTKKQKTKKKSKMTNRKAVEKS